MVTLNPDRDNIVQKAHMSQSYQNQKQETHQNGTCEMTCSGQELLKIASVRCSGKGRWRRQVGESDWTGCPGGFAYFYLLNSPAHKLI